MTTPSGRSAATYALVLAVGVAAGTGTGFFAASPSGGQAAGQDILTALETQTGQELELLQVEREQGMFRVDVRTANDQIQTYYSSTTGDLFFTEASATDPQAVTTIARQRQQLGNCLRRKDATLYGNVSQRATQLQIRALGQRNLNGVYQDVNNASVLSTAVQQGVQRTPALAYNGSALPGVNTPQGVANFTGCSFETGQ